jgi:hypothetical protein
MSDNTVESLSPATETHVPASNAHNTRSAPDITHPANPQTPDLCAAAHAGAEHLQDVATAKVAERAEDVAAKVRKIEHDLAAVAAHKASGFTLQHPIAALSRAFVLGWVIGLLCDKISFRLRKV